MQHAGTVFTDCVSRRIVFRNLRKEQMISTEMGIGKSRILPKADRQATTAALLELNAGVKVLSNLLFKKLNNY